MTALPPDLVADIASFLRARARAGSRLYRPVGPLAPRSAAGSRRSPGGPVAGEAGEAAGAAPRQGDRTLDTFHHEIEDCVKCALGRTRTRFVFGAGSASASLMLVGEAPGREEDLQGIPFVGAAGELLTKILAAIGLSRDEVYIANVLKCRPPGNRDPLPEEIAACRPHLMEQIRLVSPRVLCALGRFATQLLTGQEAPLSRLRGQVFPLGEAIVIPTYHPSALLRNPSLKRPAWDDMKRVRAELDRLGLR